MKIKIGVAIFKRGFRINSPAIQLIHAGRAVATAASSRGKVSKADLDWLKKHAIGDDTGDNISSMNREYCEASVIYWMWKNLPALGMPEYVGLMHHRRFFAFETQLLTGLVRTDVDRCYSFYRLPFASRCVQGSALKFDEQSLEQLLGNGAVDLIFVDPARLNLIGVKSVREDYATKIDGVNVKDFDLAISRACNMYPTMAASIRQYAESPNKIWYNMFVMKRALFIEACEFCFKILHCVSKEIDTDNYSLNGKRTLAYLSEILMGAFIYSKTQGGGITYKTFPVVFIENASLSRGASFFKAYLVMPWRIIVTTLKCLRGPRHWSQHSKERIRLNRYLHELLLVRKFI